MTTFSSYLKINWDKKQCDYLFLANQIHGNKHSYGKSLKICISQYKKRKGYDGYYNGLNKRLTYLLDYFQKQTDRYNNIFYDKLNKQLDASMNEISSQLNDVYDAQKIYIKQKKVYNKRLKKKSELLNNIYLNTYNYKKDEKNKSKYDTKEYIRYITNA